MFEHRNDCADLQRRRHRVPVQDQVEKLEQHATPPREIWLEGGTGDHHGQALSRDIGPKLGPALEQRRGVKGARAGGRCQIDEVR